MTEVLVESQFLKRGSFNNLQERPVTLRYSMGPKEWPELG